MSGLFTIEQVELIRRLRNTGISKEQDVQFDVSPACSSASLDWNAAIGRSPRQNQADCTPGFDLQDNSPEMLELLNKGEVTVCEEIRNFITKYNIRQHVIGAQVGLSQSYVSRFCRGELYDMSEKSKKCIYRWYASLLMKIKESDSGDAQPIIDYLTTPVPYNRQLSGQEVSDSTPRRERFTFKPAHIEILEKAFNLDNYPIAYVREELAYECNAAAQIPGKEVTGQMVTSWFANKRKDMKKIHKQGSSSPANPGIDSRPRGRPRGSCNRSRPDEESRLSQQVELAAVSQAIVSLSGQENDPDSGSSIKAEYDDEEFEDSNNT